MARNFRLCRVTSMVMQASLVATVADGRNVSGAVMSAGPGASWPLTVPTSD